MLNVITKLLQCYNNCTALRHGKRATFTLTASLKHQEQRKRAYLKVCISLLLKACDERLPQTPCLPYKNSPL